MFDKWMQYSYAAQKRERYRLLRGILVLFALYLLYNSITAFFVSVWVLRNESMQPGLHSGDRLLVTSITLPSLFADLQKGKQNFPVKRGTVVLIDTRRAEKRKPYLLAADAFVRFFTAQRVSILGSEEHLFLKRIIALPGDEISMTNFVLRVKPAGSSYTLTEFELSEKPYYPNIPEVRALWDESLPFAGNMDRIVLGPDECFAVSDDRSNTRDSRTWGPLSPDLIIGKAAFRFWPITGIGRP